MSEESGKNPSLDQFRSLSLADRAARYQHLAFSMQELHRQNIVYGNFQESNIFVSGKNYVTLILGYSEYMTFSNDEVAFGIHHKLKLTKIGDIQAFGKTIEALERIIIPPPIKLPHPIAQSSEIERANTVLDFEQKCKDPLFKKFSEIVQRCIYDNSNTFLSDEVIAAFDKLVNNVDNPLLIPSMDLSYSFPNMILNRDSANNSKNPLRQYKEGELLPEDVRKTLKVFRRSYPKYYDIVEVSLSKEFQKFPRKIIKPVHTENNTAVRQNVDANSVKISPSEFPAQMLLENGTEEESFEAYDIDNAIANNSIYENNRSFNLCTSEKEIFRISVSWIVSALFVGLVVIPVFLFRHRNS